MLRIAFTSFPSFLWRRGPTRAVASSFTRFLDHIQRRITVGKTNLDEWSAGRRDLYLTTHTTNNRKTSMTQPGFEPTTVELPQTYALDRAPIGILVFISFSLLAVVSLGCYCCWVLLNSSRFIYLDYILISSWLYISVWLHWTTNVKTFFCICDEYVIHLFVCVYEVRKGT